MVLVRVLDVITPQLPCLSRNYERNIVECVNSIARLSSLKLFFVLE